MVKGTLVIYMERPLKAASHTIHIEVPPNPFWASIGLSVTPLSLGSGVQYESRVSLGYLNQSFQNAVRDGIRYGLEQGLFGWKRTVRFALNTGFVQSGQHAGGLAHWPRLHWNRH